jgi:pimeloyl-ACP methyl ester carboxylesterase
MARCEHAGRSIYYEEFGDRAAPPLLLVMGLALSSRAWYRLPQRLAPRFFVIRFDNRGTGQSAPSAPFYRMSQLADDAAAVLASSGVRGRESGGGAFVFGISMGGMIAQELALRHPHLVRSLALGCTFACWRRSHRPSPAITLDFLRATVQPWRGLHPLRHVLFSRQFTRANPEEIARWIAVTERCGVTNLWSQLFAIARHSTVNRLSQISVPTLILSGDADRLVPVANSHALAEHIKGSRLCIFEGAGHVFPLEREDDTVRILEDFFLSDGGMGRQPQCF